MSFCDELYKRQTRKLTLDHRMSQKSAPNMDYSSSDDSSYVQSQSTSDSEEMGDSVVEDDVLTAVQEGGGMAVLQTSVIDLQCAQAQIWQKIKQLTKHIEKLQDDVALVAKSLEIHTKQKSLKLTCAVS